MRDTPSRRYWPHLWPLWAEWLVAFAVSVWCMGTSSPSSIAAVLVVGARAFWVHGYMIAERNAPPTITRSADGALVLDVLRPGESVEVPLEWLQAPDRRAPDAGPTRRQ